ncbi:hypothetical protein Q7A53_05215 [Halobacillus rhizosphaerae]|uniref:hypothetical protein n=1 Tax=Halobacillus rhizosphaerae TaxID=3064889 RepID=UPI00398AD804
MSHASGTVTFKKDNLVMHYEYDGTSDVCIPALYKTNKEMSENWRNHEWRECTCEKDEDVVIYSDYGSGFDWEGKACRHCMCITKNLIPTEYQYDASDPHGFGFWGIEVED